MTSGRMDGTGDYDAVNCSNFACRTLVKDLWGGSVSRSEFIFIRGKRSNLFNDSTREWNTVHGELKLCPPGKLSVFQPQKFQLSSQPCPPPTHFPRYATRFKHDSRYPT